MFHYRKTSVKENNFVTSRIFIILCLLIFAREKLVT